METPKPALPTQLKQILSRMFPFERGLTHAYWCPNFWALYNIADKFAVFYAKRFLGRAFEGGSQFSGGLVGLNQGTHVVLPTIKPIVTILLSGGTAMLTCAFVLWKRRSSNVRVLLECILHSSFAFFSFGWHVHEKAVIMLLVPLSLLIVDDQKVDLFYTKWFAFTSIVGTYSLFPLLFHQQEQLIKYCLLVCFVFLLFTFIARYTSVSYMFNLKQRIYLFGIIVVELFNMFHHLIFPTFPFLPLMVISVYCAIGIMYTWISLLLKL
jgi:alpha-1,3-glucosyltransferase